MSRPLRIEFPGAYYHLMNRGRGREVIYKARGDYQRFLELLEETCRMWAIRVHAYCLLPNHYHLLIETPQGNLSRVMRHLDGIYTQRHNRAHRTDGPLFRGRYKAILIDADSYLLQLVRYIHLNPVEAHLVKEPEGYSWSSHRRYLGRGKGIDGLVSDEVLGRFHTKRVLAVEGYRRFIREGMDESTREVFGRRKWPAMWGSRRFMDEVKKRLRGKEGYEIPQLKKSRPRVSLKQIEEMICQLYATTRAQISTKRRGHWNEPRNVALYLGRTMGGYTLKELGERWGGLRYSSTSAMIVSVKKALVENSAVRKRINRIEHGLLNHQT
jgi:REP-associated tyrosine transposase